MTRKKRTCVMCGAEIGKIGQIVTYTGALMFGNKSRDPHVGPYCKDCVPPAIAELCECVKDCPLTGAEWIPVDGNCITRHPKRYPYRSPKCEFSLGMSPIRHGISCTHPDRLKEAREKKQARLLIEADG